MKRKFMPAVGVAVGLAIIFGVSSQASATVATCSGIYFGAGTPGESNGTTTLPGTDVGTVQAGCQIGNIATNNDTSTGTGVFILSPNANPSIFQFTWDGGDLLIQQKFGNNGRGPSSIDVELGLLLGNSLSGNALTNHIASINFSGSFPSPFQTLWNGALDAGTYVIDTYGGLVAEDPTYQINFTVGTVPEPASLAIFGTALVGLGVIRRRRKRA